MEAKWPAMLGLSPRRKPVFIGETSKLDILKKVSGQLAECKNKDQFSKSPQEEF
jgi:hypothetical protein